MRLRKTLLMAAASIGIAAFGPAANAQEKGTAKKPGGDKPGQNGQRTRRPNLLRRAMDELNLSETQKTKAAAILKKAGEERKAVRENTALTPEQKREKMQAMEKKTRAAIEAILNADQKKKLAAMREKAQAERAARAKERGAAGGGSSRPGTPAKPGAPKKPGA
jgi:hypothetical protein